MELERMGCHAVGPVGRDRRQRRHHEEEVEPFGAVLGEDGTMLGGGAAAGVGELPLPLADDEEECEEVGAREQEEGGRDVGQCGPGERPQRQARGDDSGLQERDALEPERVADHEGRVEKTPEPEGGTDKECHQESRRQEHCRRPQRRRDSQLPGRERPPALDGVRPVALAVHDVIDEIDRARHDAEDHEAGGSDDPAARLAERPAEEKRQRQDEVLDPLLRAQRDKQGRQWAHRGVPGDRGRLTRRSCCHFAHCNGFSNQGRQACGLKSSWRLLSPPLQLPGTLIEGKYEILGKIREGGMGTIYRVRHRLLDEIRVVKVLKPQALSNEEMKRRFVEEARTATRLKHPNIGTIHDFALDEKGKAYLVMEFIDGVNLADLLKQQGPPGIALSLEVAHQALLALGYLHRKNVVHRDIAPDNLMLTHDEDRKPVVKLIDLVITKTLDRPGEMTSTGVFLGKLKYASPEQFGSLPAGEKLDGRCDLYALGVVLYELLTGVHPFVGESPSELLRAHLFDPPLAFSRTDPDGKVPPEVREALGKALQKRREDRFGSAEAFDREIVLFQQRFSHPDDLDDTAQIISKLRGIAPSASEPTPSVQDRLDRQFLAASTPHPSRDTVLRPVGEEKTEVVGEARLSPAGTTQIDTQPLKRPPKRSRLLAGGAAAIVLLAAVALLRSVVLPRSAPKAPVSAPAPTPAPTKVAPDPALPLAAPPAQATAAAEAPTVPPQPTAMTQEPPPAAAPEQSPRGERREAEQARAPERVGALYDFGASKEQEGRDLFARGEFSAAAAAFDAGRDSFVRAQEWTRAHPVQRPTVSERIAALSSGGLPAHGRAGAGPGGNGRPGPGRIAARRARQRRRQDSRDRRTLREGAVRPRCRSLLSRLSRHRQGPCAGGLRAASLPDARVRDPEDRGVAGREDGGRARPGKARVSAPGRERTARRRQPCDQPGKARRHLGHHQAGKLTEKIPDSRFQIPGTSRATLESGTWNLEPARLEAVVQTHQRSEPGLEAVVVQREEPIDGQQEIPHRIDLETDGTDQRVGVLSLRHQPGEDRAHDHRRSRAVRIRVGLERRVRHADDLGVAERAADGVHGESQPRAEGPIEAAGVGDLVGDLAPAGSVSGPGVPGVQMRRESAEVGRPDEKGLRLHGPGSEQVPLLSGRKPQVGRDGEARAAPPPEAELAAEHDVADPGSAPALAKRVVVRAVQEAVDRGGGAGREPLDRGVRLGFQLDPDDRNRGADVQAVREAIGRNECRDVGLELQQEPRRDHVSLEEELNVGGVLVRVLVREDQADVPVAKVQAVDLVELEMRKVQAEVELPFSDRLGALRVDGTEALRRSREGAQGGIEAVGEPAGGRGHGERGELIGELRGELPDRRELRRFRSDEVRLVTLTLRRRRERDALPEEVGQEIAQVEALGGERSARERNDGQDRDNPAGSHTRTSLSNDDLLPTTLPRLPADQAAVVLQVAQRIRGPAEPLAKVGGVVMRVGVLRIERDRLLIGGKRVRRPA